MASAFSHAVAAAAIGSAFPHSRLPLASRWLGIVWSIVPDVDIVGFRLGLPYDAPLGHRGLSHSIAFAAVVATAVAWLHRAPGASFRHSTAFVWCYFFLAIASHGVLDAMTDGGLGVAFFAPFSNARYFLPWRPIAAAPTSIGAFFSTRGLQILATEIRWIWIPAALFALAMLLIGRVKVRRVTDVEARPATIGFVRGAILTLALCAGLAGVYVWAAQGAIQENRYATYAETKTPEARWLSAVLPPSATLIHERHAIEIDLLYGSFRFDPGERPSLESRLRPGLRSNITIDHDSSFESSLPRRPSVELLQRSGFEFYSNKDFGFAIDRNKGIAFFWYSPPE
jgi:inner membrane protein